MWDAFPDEVATSPATLSIAAPIVGPVSLFCFLCDALNGDLKDDVICNTPCSLHVQGHAAYLEAGRCDSPAAA